MNVAFTSLVLFLLVTPGLVFRHSYRVGVGNFPALRKNLTEEIALASLIACPLHVVWCTIARVLPLAVSPDPPQALTLLAGTGGENVIQPTLSAVSSHMCWIGAYLGTLCIAAGVSGLLLRRAYFRWQFVRSLPFARLDDSWPQLLTPKIAPRVFHHADLQNSEVFVVTRLTAVVDCGGRAYLFRGVLWEVIYDERASVDRFVLQDADRRLIEKDRESHLGEKVDASKGALGTTGCGDDRRFYSIDGRYLVVRYADARNLNIKHTAFRLKTTGTAGSATAEATET